jgi:RNA methyltransferase, TrmH family
MPRTHASKLKEKKYRRETGEFVVEGKKSILELLDSTFEVIRIYVTLDASAVIESAVDSYTKRTGYMRPELIVAREEKLIALGTLRSNNTGVAIARAKAPITIDEVLMRATHELVLVLDDVRDPGNLGTIIRTADWFGVSLVVVSPTTVDALNPKVIAASMGSFTRVDVTTFALDTFLAEAQKNTLPILGAFLDGTSINELSHQNHGILVIGSESHGVSDLLSEFIETKVTIPRYGEAESLNVGVATAVILGALRR